jgi:hypothetical protein
MYRLIPSSAPSIRLEQPIAVAPRAGFGNGDAQKPSGTHLTANWTSRSAWSVPVVASNDKR